MKMQTCVMFVLIPVVTCSIITEYKTLQIDGMVTDLEMLQCQLRANGDGNCAVRINTTTTNGVKEEYERCEHLPVEWCWSRIMDPGFTYIGKQTVVHTPPYTFYHYKIGMSWGTWEPIPVSIEPGTKLEIRFNPPKSHWHKIRIDLYTQLGQLLYEGSFYPSTSSKFVGYPSVSIQYSTVPAILKSGIKSTIVVTFDQDSIMVYVDGVLDIDYSYDQDPKQIRILQFVFFDNPGNIDRISYHAATL